MLPPELSILLATLQQIFNLLKRPPEPSGQTSGQGCCFWEIKLLGQTGRRTLHQSWL